MRKRQIQLDTVMTACRTHQNALANTSTSIPVSAPQKLKAALSPSATTVEDQDLTAHAKMHALQRYAPRRKYLMRIANATARSVMNGNAMENIPMRNSTTLLAPVRREIFLSLWKTLTLTMTGEKKG